MKHNRKKTTITTYKRARVQNYKFLITTVCILLSIIMSVTGYGAVLARAASAKNNTAYYTSIQILPGDTLWTIAHTYMTDDYDSISDYITEIRAINHISGDGIHAGRYLMIPYQPEDAED